MIPLITTYDDYIERPKLSEQKKAHGYIVLLPLKWVGTITHANFAAVAQFDWLNELFDVS